MRRSTNNIALFVGDGNTIDCAGRLRKKLPNPEDNESGLGGSDRVVVVKLVATRAGRNEGASELMLIGPTSAAKDAYMYWGPHLHNSFGLAQFSYPRGAGMFLRSAQRKEKENLRASTH